VDDVTGGPVDRGPVQARISQRIGLYTITIADTTVAADGSFIVEGTANEDGLRIFGLEVASSGRIDYSDVDSTSLLRAAYFPHRRVNLETGANNVGTLRLRPTGLVRVHAELSEPLVPGDVLMIQANVSPDTLSGSYATAYFHGADDPPPYTVDALAEGESMVFVRWVLRRQGSVVASGTRPVECRRHQLVETTLLL
jgi:hypothetical protein